MKRRKGFTLVELLVVIAIIALLMSILMPALSKAKALARDMLCMNNVKNWGLFCAMYTQDNEDYFFQGLIGTPNAPTGMSPLGFWYYALRPYYLTDENLIGPTVDSVKKYNWGWGDDILRCPIAMRPTSGGSLIATLAPSALGSGTYGSPDAAWGIFDGSDPRWPRGLWGSYTSNQWICDQPAGKENDAPIGQKGYWRHSKQRNSHNIPVLVCGRWPYAWQGPFDVQEPPETEYTAGSSENGMNKMCVNRHNGYVNGVFMNFVPRKVGLKELWTLKWHQLFNTAGPYTGPGASWPDWMRKYRNY